MKLNCLLTVAALVAGMAGFTQAAPMGTAFTCHGHLMVTNGLVSVVLDYGAGAFNGDARWLQISMRTSGSGSSTQLTPRQAVMPTPYAMMALNAALLGLLPAAQLSGTLAGANLSGTYSGVVTFNQPANSFTVLPAAGTQPLTTETRLLEVDSSYALPLLQFTFGFATDENPAPGQFGDSFSVTLQDSSLTTTMIFLTADASGVVWAPPTPGTGPIAPEWISWTVAPFPDGIEPVLARQFAYRVQVPLASDFAGQTLNVHFDLFDNLNGVGSFGWFSEVTVVPEPRLLALNTVVLLFYFLRRKR